MNNCQSYETQVKDWTKKVEKTPPTDWRNHSMLYSQLIRATYDLKQCLAPQPPTSLSGR